MEMQSEAGAAGTVHGSLQGGALTTTFTASQGLLLMIPNMYKIAGELLPCVINVSARCDCLSRTEHLTAITLMYTPAARPALRCSARSTAQEVMDLGAVAHLSAIKSTRAFPAFLRRLPYFS